MTHAGGLEFGPNFDSDFEAKVGANFDPIFPFVVRGNGWRLSVGC
jgi:hypothetical protein